MDQNVCEWLKGRKYRYPEEKVKVLVYQLVKALFAVHKAGFFHRDIKPENVLLSHSLLKLADFGSCKGIYTKQPFTDYICTRWYRAPECLLTNGYYNYKADIWSFGCVFAEMLTMKPLFAGQNELEQVRKIYEVLGSPDERLVGKFREKGDCEGLNLPYMQGTGLTSTLGTVSPEALTLITKLLALNPDDRPSTRQILKDSYFSDLVASEQIPESPFLRPKALEPDGDEVSDHLLHASDMPKSNFKTMIAFKQLFLSENTTANVNPARRQKLYR